MPTKPSSVADLSVETASEDEGFLELSGLYKRFGDVTAVEDVNLTIKRGEFFALLGPSGCGKTTTMRCIAGFEEPSAGDVLINGESVLGLHPSRRNTGMVFQNYALFPHYDVFRNVAYGLIMDQLRGNQRFTAIRNLIGSKAARKDERLRARVEEALAQVQLSGYENRKITELSGGQQQRVALARALIKRPSLLLMDEPLSNLDAGLRNEMRTVIRDIQRDVGITTVFVTHDQEEAMSMADRVGLMRDGQIIQCTAPETLYERPVSAWAANFVGKSNLIDGVVAESTAGVTRVKVGEHELRTLDAVGLAVGEECTLMIRPEDMRILRDQEGNAPEQLNLLDGRLERSTFLGGNVVYELQTHFGAVDIEESFKGEGTLIDAGTEVTLGVPYSRVHVLQTEAERGEGDGDD